MTRPNYLDWIRTLRFNLRYKNKEYVLHTDVPKLLEVSIDEDVVSYKKHYDESTKVDCLMLETVSSKLH